MPKAQRVGRFTSAQARDRFLQAYDVAMGAWPQPRSEVDVHTRFGTVHVHRFGRTQGRPIVLLHGAAGTSSNWYPQVAELGACHPVYAIDTIDDPGRSVQQSVVIGSTDNAAGGPPGAPPPAGFFPAAPLRGSAGPAGPRPSRTSTHD